MSENTIRQEVLEKIEREKLQPKPRWTFLMKRSLVWVAAVLSILIGSVATSVGLYMFANNDYALYSEGGGNVWKYALASAPYVWIGLLVLFLGISIYQFRHTKDGYRHHAVTVLFASVALALAIGVGLHLVGVGRYVDHIFEENIPIYSEILSPRHNFWNAPEEGRLAGIILSTEGRPTRYAIRTIDGTEWTVELEHPNDLEMGMLVRVIGEMKGGDIFHASSIQAKPKGTPFGPKRPRRKAKSGQAKPFERFPDQPRMRE